MKCPSFKYCVHTKRANILCLFYMKCSHWKIYKLSNKRDSKLLMRALYSLNTATDKELSAESKQKLCDIIIELESKWHRVN